MAAETYINVSFRDALLRVSGWDPADVVADDRKAGDMFEGRQIKPDVLLTLPAHPPMLVECKGERRRRRPGGGRQEETGGGTAF